MRKAYTILSMKDEKKRIDKNQKDWILPKTQEFSKKK